MIESIRIENFKALRDVTLNLTPIHLLIGKNGSGKTSILEAITALCRSVDFDLPSAFLGRWSGRGLIFKGAGESSIRFTADQTSNQEFLRYLLEVSFLSEGKNVAVEREKIQTIADEYDITHRDRYTAVNRFISERRRMTSVPTELLARIGESLSTARTCRWSGRMLSLPVAFEGDGRPFEQSDSGFGLALALDDILGSDRDCFVDLERQFQSIFPQVKSIKLVREPGYRLPPNDRENVPVLQPGSGKGIRFDYDNGMTDIPASQASEGELIVLAYLATLYSLRPPRFLLVEEPENGIHPERLVEVISLLREIIVRHPTTQVIITTHSPYLVSQFAPQEVTLCHKELDSSITLHRLSHSSEVKKQSSIFTLGEIWTGEGDDNLAKSTISTEATSP